MGLNPRVYNDQIVKSVGWIDLLYAHAQIVCTLAIKTT